jgi:hypothetical protein
MRKIIAGIAIVLGTIATGWFSMSPASASPTPELCVGTAQGTIINPIAPCADAYNNGGSLIKSYQPGATWENVQMQSIGNGNWQLYDANTGLCLGDNGNNQFDAKIGDTDLCPTSGNAGWGTIFSFFSESGCSTGTGALYDHHWNGDITGFTTNGSQWYLNATSGTGLCLYPFGSPGF